MFKRDVIADWITIVSGGITAIGFIISIFNQPATKEQVVANNEVALVLIAIYTIFAIAFFFELAFRLPKVLANSGKFQMPELMLRIFAYSICISFYAFVEILFVNFIYPQHGDDIYPYIFIAPIMVGYMTFLINVYYNHFDGN